MDSLLDRFERMLRLFFSPGEQRPPGWGQDPDFLQAWRELDEYLAGGAGPPPRREPRRPGGGTQRRDRAPAGEALHRDYANLEVAFGAPLAEVTRAYKTLLKRYHPDKFAADPEKQQLATEITLRINLSYQNIRNNLQAKP
jgi:DnaJ-domain-containing protein 1